MQYNKTILTNGLRVITVPMPSFESVTVLVMVGAGSRYENRKNSGISHFLEHMAFKGTEKRPDAMAISSVIDGMGGEFNAFTGRETTGYYIKSAVSNMELCLDVLSDMLMHSKLDQIEIDKEKGVIIEEINLYEDTPSRKIGDLYEELLYGDTPMGWDVAGFKDVVKSVQRLDFIDYMNSLYSSDNITVVVSGGINNNETIKLVEKYFSEMKRFDTIGFNKVVDSQESPKVLIKQKETEQVHIALGVRTVHLEHPDRYPLELLSAILGGGMSSRLFHEVREKRGLGYYVRTSSEQYIDCGSLVSYAGIDPKRTEEAIKVIIEEYQAITSDTKKITEEELQKAKEFLKGHFVLDLEDSRSVASFYAHQELLEKTIENPAQIISQIEDVTLDQVTKAAKTYLSNPISLAVVGNFPNGQKFEELIK